MAGECLITCLSQGAIVFSHEIDCGSDWLRPECNPAHRIDNVRAVSCETMLVHQVTPQFGKKLRIAVAVKYRPEHGSPIAECVRRGAAYPMLQAELHHTAHL